MPIIFYFDPIIGVALNAHTLKAATPEQEQTGHHLLRLPKPLKQAVLVPIYRQDTTTNHIRPLCLIMDDLTVSVTITTAFYYLLYSYLISIRDIYR